MSTNNISNRINRIMFELQINQNQLAKQLKITQPAISKYLRGRMPPPMILLQLAKLSGKSIEWILTGESDYTSKTQIVSEKQHEYHINKNLEAKINKLPYEIKVHLEGLIDSILIKQ